MADETRKRALVGLAVLSFALLAWVLPPAAHPASGAGQGFTFAASGDLGWNSATDASLNKLAGIGGVSFFLALGDLGYSSNAAGWCGYFKGKFNDLEFITGNHDTTESGPGVLYGSSGYIQNCPFTLGVKMTGKYGVEYYFDYPMGNPLVRFVLVAAGIGGEVNYDYSQGTPHYQWTVNAIDGARAAGIPWVVVGMHKPCLNTGMHGCGIPPSFEQMLVAKRVDLVLQGHDHNYQRTKQLACEVIGSYAPGCVADPGPNRFTKGNGTEKLIAGTFGASFYAIDRGDPNYPYFVTTQANSHGFVKYTVTATSITADFVASTGSYKDGFSIAKPPPPPVVSIASPSEGQVFEVANITVSGNATDLGGMGLRDVEVRVDGGPWQPANGASPWSASVELKSGANIIEARARDNSGGVSTIENVTVTYSPPPPPPNPPPPPPPPVPPPPALSAVIVANRVVGTLPFTAAFGVQVKTGTPPYAYLWDFGDGSTSALEAPTHTFGRPGTYMITLRVTDAAGLSTTEKLEVTAHENGTTTFQSPSPGPPWALYAATVAAVTGGIPLILWMHRRRKRTPPKVQGPGGV